jgi:hypothetical protein
MSRFDIPGGKDTEETKITNNNKPKGIKKATKEPLISSLQEAFDRAKLGARAEKAKAWKFIYEEIDKEIDKSKVTPTKKQWIKEKIIYELIKLEAVPELGELNEVDALYKIGITASEEVIALAAVKKLGELNAVDALFQVAITVIYTNLYSYRDVIIYTTKTLGDLYAVDALQSLVDRVGGGVSDLFTKAAEAAEEQLTRLKNKNVIEEIQKLNIKIQTNE